LVVFSFRRVTQCFPSRSILILVAVPLAGGQELGKLFLAVEHAGPDAKESNASRVAGAKKGDARNA
jgi:hypothetical protein